MQNELNKAYEEYLEFLFSKPAMLDSIDKYELSSPQFISVDVQRGNYVSSDIKILFVGKETNGWFNKDERVQKGLETIRTNRSKYLEALLWQYREFNLGESWYSPIFQFIDIVRNEFEKQGTMGCLITELIRHDYNGSSLPYDMFREIDRNNNEILRKEIEILNPDILIFLTGPSYDWYITNTYERAEVLPVEKTPYRKNQVAKIMGISGVKSSFRIYHPDYHNRLGAQFKYDMAKLIYNQFAK